MKKAIFLLSLFLCLTLVSPAEAKSEKGKGLGQRIIQSVQEALSPGQISSGTPRIKNQVQQTIWERLKAKFPKLLPAGLNQAEVISIAGTVLPTEVVVSYEGKEVTLKLSQKTLILRKYGGQAALSELKKGDLVSARGTWEDSETKAVLDVRVLRDLSLEKRQATFWGKITALGEGSLTMETSKKGSLTIIVGSSTKIVDRRERSVPLTSLAVGHRVRVTGLWDVAEERMDPVRLIKDWSLGPKPTSQLPTVTPAITPTPSPTQS